MRLFFYLITMKSDSRVLRRNRKTPDQLRIRIQSSDFVSEKPSLSNMKGSHNFITSVAKAIVITYFLCKKIKIPLYS